MNERIKKLGEQAKQYAREQMAHPMDRNLFSAAVFEAKFAELIIKECLFAIVSSVDRPAFERKIYHGIITNYFGVNK